MTATLLPNARFVAYDANGAPLAAGQVETFIPGTGTHKTTWQDAAQATPNDNPHTLDSAGSMLLYGSGDYQVTVTDSLGNSVPGYSGLSRGDVVSDAMAPVVSASTTLLGLEALGLQSGTATALQAASVFLVGQGLGLRQAPQLRVQTSDTYAYQSSDDEWVVLRQPSSLGNPVTFDTLPHPILPARWTVTVQNIGLNLLVISGATPADLFAPIEAGFMVLGSGQTATFASSGATYYVIDRPTRAKVNAAGPAGIFYVNSSGSDANHGLTAASPLKTIDQARFRIYNWLDHSNTTPTIQLAAATFTDGLHCVGLPMGAPAVNITGNPASPGTCWVNPTVGPAIAGGYGANVLANGILMSGNGANSTFIIGGVAIISYNGAEANFINSAFAASTVSHISATAGGTTQSIGTPYNIQGGAQFHMTSSQSGTVIIGDTLATVTGTVNFSNAFAAANSAASIYVNNSSWTGGTVTGARFGVSENGVIQTNSGGDLNFFPGNAPGVAGTGGQYS